MVWGLLAGRYKYCLYRKTACALCGQPPAVLGQMNHTVWNRLWRWIDVQNLDIPKGKSSNEWKATTSRAQKNHVLQICLIRKSKKASYAITWFWTLIVHVTSCPESWFNLPWKGGRFYQLQMFFLNILIVLYLNVRGRVAQWIASVFWATGPRLVSAEYL